MTTSDSAGTAEESVPITPDKTAAESIEAAVVAAMAEVDAIAGTTPERRPPYLRQLNQVLENAAVEAKAAEHRTTNVGRNADAVRLVRPRCCRGLLLGPIMLSSMSTGSKSTCDPT